MKKISEAMREGAKQGKQLIGFLRNPDGGGDSCAMGAVCIGLGLGKLQAYELYPLVTKMLPKIGEPIACPECGTLTHAHNTRSESDTQSGIGVIVALNNRHGWSRERIADWVEQTYEGGGAKIPFVEIMEFIGVTEARKGTA